MAAEKKEQQQKLLREHRKEAATLGKKPYYIKKCKAFIGIVLWPY